MPTRNDIAGNGYELELVHRYNAFEYKDEKGNSIPFFPKVDTSKNVDKFIDHEFKVDICTENVEDLTDFGLLIQAKNKSSIPAYPKLLNSLKKARLHFKGIPVVYHWQTQRVQNSPDVVPRFTKRGEFALLNASDFEKIWVDLQRYKIAMEIITGYMEFLREEQREEIDKILKGLGL